MDTETQWRVLVAETLSGHIVADVAATDMPRFSRALNDKGSFTITVPVGHRTNRGLDLHAYTQTGKYSWIVAYGTTVCQAGPVRTYRYADEQGQLSISGTGIGGEFPRRVLRNPAGHTAITDPSEDLTYREITAHDLMRLLVVWNMEQPDYRLPIALPEPERVPGPYSGTYYGYELAMVWKRLTEVADFAPGAEFDFVPEFATDNRIQWRMRLGTPRLGDQASPAVWDYGAALGGVDVDVDGSTAPATRTWSVGSGSERTMLTGFAADRNPIGQGHPPLDRVDREHTTVEDQARLEALAETGLTEHARPVSQWKATVRADGARVSPALGEFALGDAPLFAIHAHRWLRDGTYRRRILGISTRSRSEIALDLAETPASS